MKKLLLVCVLAFAIAGSAQAAYIWGLNATDPSGANYGSSVSLGTAGNTTATQSWPTPTAAYAGEVVFTGSLGPDMVKTTIRKTNFTTTDPHVWNIQIWAATGYAASTVDVRLWTGVSTSFPTGTWYLYKLYDPIAAQWPATPVLLGQVSSFSVTSQTNPLLKVNLPVFKTDLPLNAGQGYILQLRDSVIPPIPEPGSLVAVLSGLVGLAGFGIRRRR